MAAIPTLVRRMDNADLGRYPVMQRARALPAAICQFASELLLGVIVINETFSRAFRSDELATINICNPSWRQELTPFSLACPSSVPSHGAVANKDSATAIIMISIFSISALHYPGFVQCQGIGRWSVLLLGFPPIKLDQI